MDETPRRPRSVNRRERDFQGTGRKGRIHTTESQSNTARHDGSKAFHHENTKDTKWGKAEGTELRRSQLTCLFRDFRVFRGEMSSSRLAARWCSVSSVTLW